MPLHSKSLHVDLAYQAYPDTPIPDGRRLEVPFRDPRMPIFWEVDRYPKLPRDKVVEKCLVFWQNTTPAVMRAFHKYIKSVKIPEGHLIVKPHWYIFARDVHGSGSPEDNVLQAWTLDKNGMPALVSAKFREMRDRNLGCRSQRTPNKPRKVKGQFTQEGITWEQHRLAKSIEKNERAYPMTLSFEQQHNLVGPCAGTKIHDDITVHNRLRAETVAHYAPVNKKIKQELGKFGGKHIDGHDSDAGITCMITDSNIDEETEEWGYFNYEVSA
ncbi:hypothetical protein LXA43DRAFT_1097015 [Ganoderma leucocontextum]|nr:hypothetical protein LXA43DRAFT_1097015 [Ganoderma leucocontextum]